MNQRESKRLAQLLIQVKKEKGWLPKKAWRPFHDLCAWGAVELIVPHPKDRTRILLYHRRDEDFIGWSLPGGYIRPEDQSLDDACSRVFRRELGEAVQLTRIQQFPYVEKWNDHPYGHPISIPVICFTKGKLPLSKQMKFFSSTPRNLVKGSAIRKIVCAYFSSLRE